MKKKSFNPKPTSGKWICKVNIDFFLSSFPAKIRYNKFWYTSKRTNREVSKVILKMLVIGYIKNVSKVILKILVTGYIKNVS